jgi:hypothetical protein
MHLILRYPSGRLVDGLLLAVGSDRMRIVVRRFNETMELRLAEDHWVSERGERIEVEGWLTDTDQPVFESLSRPGWRTSTATQ